jgi:DNA-binding transcriptional LysR family regulator
VRINAPLTFGILHLAPLWGEFRRLHPKVSMLVEFLGQAFRNCSWGN